MFEEILWSISTYSKTKLKEADGLSRWFSGKESACQCKRCKFDPWVRKLPGEGNSYSLQYSFLKNKYLFIYLYFCIFVCAEALFTRDLLQLCQAGAALRWRCTGFSSQWRLLWSTGPRCTDFRSCSTQAQQLRCLCSRSAGSVAVMHGHSCSMECGILRFTLKTEN